MTYLLASGPRHSSSRSISRFDAEYVVKEVSEPLRRFIRATGWWNDPQANGTQLATAAKRLGQGRHRHRQVSAGNYQPARETTVVWGPNWHAATPRAIVWQDRRAEPICVGTASAVWPQ
jgi:glycerol kinase